MAIKIGINGFGRIGRCVFKVLQQHPDLEVAGINDLADANTMAHLLKYDTAHGTFNAEVNFDEENIYCNGNKVAASAIRNPEELPWKALDIDVVFECTGIFRNREGSEKHLKAGAKKVLISAPAKGGDVPMVVLGVNESILKSGDKIISNASCTTNCLAPMAKVLNESFGIKKSCCRFCFRKRTLSKCKPYKIQRYATKIKSLSGSSERPDSNTQT